MIKKVYLYLVIISLFLSCGIINKSRRIYPIHMAETLVYGGFTIDRPIYQEWYLYPESQSWTQATFHRETESKCHTVYFYVLTDSIRENSFEEYAENIVSKRRITSDSLRFIVNISKLTKIDSVTYKFENEIIDKRPLSKSCGTLIIKEEGYILKHEYLDNFVLYMNFSERGTNIDFEHNYFEERKQFFKSVKQRKKY